MNDPCECTKQAGCEPCDLTAAKTIETLTDYVESFLARRFPEGLPPDLEKIMMEIVLDAFHDGARYSEQTRMDEALIVPAPKKTILVGGEW